MSPAFQYPEGHPLVAYVHSVYNVQLAVSAVAARATDSAVFLNEFTFEYVVAPNDLDIALTRVVDGKTNSLYRVTPQIPRALAPLQPEPAESAASDVPPATRTTAPD